MVTIHNLQIQTMKNPRKKWMPIIYLMKVSDFNFLLFSKVFFLLFLFTAVPNNSKVCDDM
ncbi:unnamed protein product [Nezara viridula]|uniref:Uncharacterized protein n=1 Tax=Nezara viridula TaxID=85310 RepID=A0A9P0H6E1_NEZVI|nr:unnamed protein product [Nezara viridula]